MYDHLLDAVMLVPTFFVIICIHLHARSVFVQSEITVDKSNTQTVRANLFIAAMLL